MCCNYNVDGVYFHCSLQHFVSDAGQYSVRMVDNLLDILTSGEHSKTTAILLEVYALAAEEIKILRGHDYSFVYLLSVFTGSLWPKE